VPWDELINPLWNKLLFYVEEAWLTLYPASYVQMRGVFHSPTSL